jgi:hypothetical protein
MPLKYLAALWQRLRQKLGWLKRGTPVWGDQSPTILGVCPVCGAIIMEGWHQEGPEGMICQRCANARQKEGQA